jgi:flavin-dependent dehydrogenase
MGLLDQLSEVGCRIMGMEIYAPNGQSIAAPIPATSGRPAYMLVVPRLTLDNTLREYALAHGALFESHVRVTDVKAQGGDGVIVSGERGGEPVSFTGRVAVIATGANPRLLMRMGLISEVPPTMVAARAYYDDINVLSDRVQFRFDGVPLPGFAWIFPTGQRSANIGAGYFAKSKRARDRLASPQDAVRSFVETSHIKSVIGRARRVSPVKGYPLRVDFTTAPTFGERILLVGEAAGLVNPLSGEGVEYALESAQVAAKHLIGMLGSADFSRARFEAYDRDLREHYQSLFEFCDRMRELFLNRPALNLLINIAARRNDLKLLLIRVVLGDHTVPRRITLGKVIRTLLLPRRPDVAA